MEERENTLDKIPAEGYSPLRFLPFTDKATGRLNWPLPAPEKLDMGTGTTMLLMQSNSILAIKAYGEYVNIYSASGDSLLPVQKTLVRNCLKHYDRGLFKYGFLRVHNSYIINIHHLLHREGSQLILSRKPGFEILVSKTYKPLVDIALTIFHF